MLGTIYPYKSDEEARILGSGEVITMTSVWVFDDERVGLSREALISGTDTVIDKITQHIPNAELGFKLTFSNFELPEPYFVGNWVKEGIPFAQYGNIVGNWYSWDVQGELIHGWLCPALFLYFDQIPLRLYVKADNK